MDPQNRNNFVIVSDCIAPRDGLDAAENAGGLEETDVQAVPPPLPRPIPAFAESFRGVRPGIPARPETYVLR